eukprot:1016453-Pleurochrysis_carterae.AAC.1
MRRCHQVAGTGPRRAEERSENCEPVSENRALEWVSCLLSVRRRLASEPSAIRAVGHCRRPERRWPS